MIAHHFLLGAIPQLPPRPRVIVYIDGFNLYYGAVKGTPRLKWLDLAAFCRRLRPHDDIQRIHYFTAMVDGPTKPNQEEYLKALATTPLVNVVLGKFKEKRVRCKVAACPHPGNKLFRTYEEKRTDVSIALALLDDAYQGLCDHQILVSGDSDLVPGIALVRSRFANMKTTVYVPSTDPIRGAAVELRASAHHNRNLPLALLAPSQFPNRFPDGAGGFLNRPAAWF